jgi:hypothetical protein
MTQDNVMVDASTPQQGGIPQWSYFTQSPDGPAIAASEDEFDGVAQRNESVFGDEDINCMGLLDSG